MFRMILLISSVLLVTQAQGASFDHSTWDKLLQAHVRILEEGRMSQVDYAGLSAKRSELHEYLQSLAKVDRETFDSWSGDEQLAFLINAYNGWTVELILTKYPNLDSIKDLGSIFQSPWKKSFIPLLGETRSIDDIEHGLIRGSGRYNDQRIHFAVNCASIGCPALRPEAYRGEVLQQQLDDATNHFLGDRSRNRLNGQVLEISPIFKWYQEDFTRGWRSVFSLAGFLANYKEALGLTEKESRSLAAGDITIRFLDYDWRLNSLHQ